MRSTQCPTCGASLGYDEAKLDNLTCSFCGQTVPIDGVSRVRIDKNINVNQHTRVQRVTTDVAEVIRARNEGRAEKMGWIFAIALFAISVGGLLYMEFTDKRTAEIAVRQGKISAGAYEDYIDQQYSAVDAHLRGAGFQNVKLVDLNDAGLAFWNNNKVTSVSIAGDLHFDEKDYFFPDSPIVVTHH